MFTAKELNTINTGYFAIKSSIDLGYSKDEGAYPFVDGQYIRGYSFEERALEKIRLSQFPTQTCSRRIALTVNLIS